MSVSKIAILSSSSYYTKVCNGIIAHAGDLEVVLTTGSCQALIDYRRVTSNTINVFLCDAAFIRVLGNDFVLELKNSGVKIVLITDDPCSSDTFKLYETKNINGILGVHAQPELIIATVHAAIDGQFLVDPKYTYDFIVGLNLYNSTRILPGDIKYTSRDLEAIKLVKAGLSNSEIAASMGITEHAVKKRLGLLFRKMGIKRRTQLASFWIGE